jgi:hypothetical protein
MSLPAIIHTWPKAFRPHDDILHCTYISQPVIARVTSMFHSVDCLGFSPFSPADSPNQSSPISFIYVSFPFVFECSYWDSVACLVFCSLIDIRTLRHANSKTLAKAISKTD